MTSVTSIDHRVCLATPAHKFACAVDEERNCLMGKDKGKKKKALEPCGHPAIVEALWTELDNIVDRLMTGQEADDGKDPGRAEGTAYALALILMPFHPDINIVRAKAMERYEERTAEDA